MGLKTKADLEKKKNDIINRAPGGPGFNKDDVLTSRHQDVKVSKHQAVKASRRLDGESIGGVVKRFTVRLDDDLYKRWKAYEYKLLQEKNTNISFQEFVVETLEKTLKKEGV